MENIYENVIEANVEVSRADVWAISGRFAAEHGMESMPGHIDSFRDTSNMDNFVSPFPTFKYGREDCQTAPYTDEVFEFPSPHMTHNEMFTYFQEVFGFDANQVSEYYRF